MSKALEARGLTLDAARLDMRRIADAHGGVAMAISVLGLPASTWHSAYSGVYGPGPKLLGLFYGPEGCVLRPEVLCEHVAEEEDVAAASPVAVVAAPIVGPDAYGGLTVAELPLRAQKRAVRLEAELEEALGEIDSLKDMADRLGGHHG